MLKRMLSVVIFLAVTTLSSGCTTTRTIVAPYPALPLPERPVLPPLPAKDLSLIKPSLAEAILTRDKMRKKYELQLESIIKSTH